MKSVLPKFIVLVAVFFLAVGCSNADNTSSKGKNGKNTTSASSKDNNESADIRSRDNKKSEETIRTVLRSIFTGPDEEQKKLYKKQMTKDPQALYPYLAI